MSGAERMRALLSARSDRGWQLIGWWLFVACAAFFIASAARSGDPLALIGSVLFMAANAAFLAPFYLGGTATGEGAETERGKGSE